MHLLRYLRIAGEGRFLTGSFPAGLPALANLQYVGLGASMTVIGSLSPEALGSGVWVLNDRDEFTDTRR